MTNISISSGFGNWSTALTENPQTGSMYTLVLGDDNKFISLNNAGSMVLGIPINGSAAFPVGCQVLMYQSGAGQVIVSGLAGVTLNCAGNKNKLNSQFSSACLLKTATDTWLLMGDTTT